MRIIDSHIHFWQYNRERYPWMRAEMKMLKKNHLPQDVAQTLERNQVEKLVVVEADPSELETHFLVELANTHPAIAGVVGWADFGQANIAERLNYFSQYPIIRGWRFNLENKDAPFDDPSLLTGLGELEQYDQSFDLLVKPHQLLPVCVLVQKFPNQKFVLDHGGRPAIRHNGLSEWQAGIRKLAELPNVHCKVSGLITEANWKDWKPADIYPYLDVLFESFGTNRLMFGSDWPVMLLAGIYVQWKSLVEKYMSSLAWEEREKVFYTNAQNFYRLAG